ncbi:hypothetical protein D3C73_1157300 [compost metagenome]
MNGGALGGAARTAGAAVSAGTGSSRPPRLGSLTVSRSTGATSTPSTPTTMKAVRQPQVAASRPPTRVPAAMPRGMPKA